MGIVRRPPADIVEHRCRVGTVWIADRERGPVSFFGNVRCDDGEPVRIEVRASGYDRWSRTIPCRVGGSLEVTARLEQR